MIHKIFNLGNLYGTISFMALICAPGAAEAELYIMATVLVIAVGVFAYLAMREDGSIKK